MSKYKKFPGFQFVDLSGVEFGRLTAIAPCCQYPKPKTNRIYWNCKCKCGNNSIVAVNSLTTENTASCGCLSIELKSDRAKQRMGVRRSPLFDRFWEKVDKTSNPNGCWTWTAALGVGGYGKIGVDGKTVKAHRVSYELTFGKFSDDLCVLHKCDNPPCVNPEHLFLGTKADNVADMDRKGRRKGSDHSGELNQSAKLKLVQVIEIKKRVANGERKALLAKEFGVSETTVKRICNGRLWSKALNNSEVE